MSLVRDALEDLKHSGYQIVEANVADEIALQQFEKQGKKFEEFLGCGQFSHSLLRLT